MFKNYIKIAIRNENPATPNAAFLLILEIVHPTKKGEAMPPTMATLSFNALK